MRKDYKEYFPDFASMERGEKGKKGQVAIFVIIAVVIVGIILVVLFYPKIKVTIQGDLNPEKYLQDCISSEVKNKIDYLGKHSGYLELKEGYYVNEGEKIKYLCYTSGYYKTCNVQDPMITSHFENQLSEALKVKTGECVNALVAQYKTRGYDVVAGSVSSKATIGLNKVNVNFNVPLTITRGTENPQTYKGFDVSVDSQISELLSIAENVVEFESKFGDSETTYYLGYYPNLKMEKIKMSDGTKVYKLSNVVTNEQFIFASRSLAWPPGLGLNQAYQNG